MAYSNRTTFSNVAPTFSDITRYSFYQLLETLYKLSGVNAEQALTLRPGEEPVRLSATAGLNFPIRDLVQLLQTEEGKYQLEVSFLGLHGTQSPLPTYYLENLAKEYTHQENRLVDFLDVFNHRLILLLHQIWRKYRYYIAFQPEGVDQFSARMFALVGLGHHSTRQQLSINPTKMLAYAGMLASPARSPDVLCSLISHCFDLSAVSIKSWRFRYAPISESEQNRLGQTLKEAGKPPVGRSCLGVNFSLGARNPDRGGKFLLEISQLTYHEFLDFLPNGKQYIPLITFVSFILKDQFAWDLRLGLRQEQIKGMRLGDSEHNNRLGWSSFIGVPDSEPSITLLIRE
ncbi:type VI secretion system baseplate subunit TssG [Muribacter muris]|uniref:Type VI secretion system baseplate subunit TssG n=1 Tax=Muribacter muris TaxID=67855 RepID=A0A4Y9JR65_9PAST|nr:type VI secretion system baseplate subunit TssG [Muribacter muris]MBF0786252.1 type VI secretion system baseplate subunit TssG [Muribacter muris]MBF0828058.1 type VI secretion system baseplate subunit TssG [Muribacter muris]TFV07389.1 type VI secretion system baseplate subunit TssG [Muribacter muris]